MAIVKASVRPADLSSVVVSVAVALEGKNRITEKLADADGELGRIGINLKKDFRPDIFKPDAAII